MIVDLKVHVEIGRQGSNMRPRDFLFAEFAKVVCWAKDLKDFNKRPRER